MSILGTGRNTLMQADFASKQSTSLANALQSNKAGLEIADKNQKIIGQGQALGGIASMALSQAPNAIIGGATASGFNASLAPAAQGVGAELGAAGGAALNGTATPASLGLTSVGTEAATGAATTAGTTAAGAAAAEGAAAGAAAGGAAAGTTGALAATQAATTGATAAAGGAAAGGAAAGGAVAAAVPVIGWVAAIGALAYSLFG